MKQLNPGFKRLKPLLGTFVEIEVRGIRCPQAAQEVISGGFSAVEKVQHQMSFHDPKSDLSRINSARPHQWVPVHPDTAHVLKISQKIQRLSNGIFDVSTASYLINWGFLPGETAQADISPAQSPGFEVKSNEVRRTQGARIDLGGVAKGYAVDRAVEAILERAPEAAGVVNAGGDLRVFGAQALDVMIRSGSAEHSKIRRTSIKEGSVATSTVRMSHSAQNREVSPYVQIKKRSPFLSCKTASVFAKQGVIADALTKVVLMGEPSVARQCLEYFGASAIVFDQFGGVLETA